VAADNCIMTGFLGRKGVGSHNALIIIRPASIDPPPLRIGFVDGGYAARALAHFAAIHSAECPLI